MNPFASVRRFLLVSLGVTAGMAAWMLISLVNQAPQGKRRHWIRARVRAWDKVALAPA